MARIQPPDFVYTALGTNAGPTPSVDRSQPAGAVRFGDDVILVDAGDGATQQLTRSRIKIENVRAVAISHLHFDHTGGLFGFLALRRQAQVEGPLTIFGPPGIRATVEGMFQAMSPGTRLLAHLQRAGQRPGDEISVVEMTDGQEARIGKISLIAAENSHFSELPAMEGAAHPVALSFRFSLGGRSLIYTGDTGPSGALAKLCKNADMLVSEIMDPVAMIGVIRKTRPDLSENVLSAAEAHFRKEHLTPDEVGRLAARCGAAVLILTHNSLLPNEIPEARTAIGRRYKGRITFARDLQQFPVPTR